MRNAVEAYLRAVPKGPRLPQPGRGETVAQLREGMLAQAAKAPKVVNHVSPWGGNAYGMVRW